MPEDDVYVEPLFAGQIDGVFVLEGMAEDGTIDAEVALGATIDGIGVPVNP